MKHTTALSGLAALIAIACSTPVLAADACSNFKWEVSREVRLFAAPGTVLAAGTTGGEAPAITPGQLYALTLQPQEKVKFAVPPTKRMLADGAFGGMLKLKVGAAGAYRIAIDAGFWLDVVHEGKPLASVDFNGSAECTGPRKIVVYELPAGAELTVQLAQANAAAARLSVTPVAAPAR